MTRRLLLTFALLATSSPLAAQQLGGSADAPLEPPTLAALITAADPPAIAVPKQTTAQPGSSPTAYDVAYQLEPSASANKSASFHPICDCGCTVECLDNWCVCDEPCCTTDQWCQYPCECSHGNCYLTPEGCWVSNDRECDVWGYPDDAYNTAFRLGGWGVATQGSLIKIGEYQDLHSSPFWDLDGISSSGLRTLDFTLSGLDNEANYANVYYYGPGMTAKLRYNRYLRRLDHDPVQGFPRPTFPAVPAPAENVIAQDLNVGEDYAIRVQQLDARFQGRISDNLKWRLNLWGMRKFGERQANAPAHCFNVNAPAPAGATGNVCHVLSQRQSIDWTTMEIEPVVEAQFDNLTVEYSRTMRSFGQSDDSIFRQYTRFNFNLPAASGQLGPDYQYGIVPESFTQFDRLKILYNLSDTRQLYANLYVGDTHNNFRDTHRQYGGYDVRLIDRSFDRLTSTAYVSMYEENNDLPTTFFTEPPFGAPPPAPPANADAFEPLSLRHPIDYNRIRAGLKGNWRPSSDPTNGLRIVGGYEYYELNRDWAIYEDLPNPTPPPATLTFEQQDTKSHIISIGPEMRWSQTRTSYVRYKGSFIDDPLIGVRENNGRFNSNQPEQVHAIDIGGTWTPTYNFTATAQVSLINSWHDSQFANFNEDSYPFFITLWHAPTQRLSLTGGYAYFSNWIDQDITLGFTVPGVPAPPLRTETTRWNYRGENHLINLNAVFAWSETVNLIAGYEWNRGINVFSVPPSPAGADWSLLPLLSDVIIETQRATLGADWQPYNNFTIFARYVFYDWNDIGARDPAPLPGWYRGNDSGVTHMALGGASVVW